MISPNSSYFEVAAAIREFEIPERAVKAHTEAIQESATGLTPNQWRNKAVAELCTAIEKLRMSGAHIVWD